MSAAAGAQGQDKMREWRGVRGKAAPRLATTKTAAAAAAAVAPSCVRTGCVFLSASGHARNPLSLSCRCHPCITPGAGDHRSRMPRRRWCTSGTQHLTGMPSGVSGGCLLGQTLWALSARARAGVTGHPAHPRSSQSPQQLKHSISSTWPACFTRHCCHCAGCFGTGQWHMLPPYQKNLQ